MNHIGLKVTLAALVAAAIGVSSGTAAPYRGVTASNYAGTLTVKGTKASEKIALRLKAGDSSILEVDAGDNGSADFSFPRSGIGKHAQERRLLQSHRQRHVQRDVEYRFACRVLEIGKYDGVLFVQRTGAG